MSFSLFNQLAKAAMAKAKAMSTRRAGAGCEDCGGSLSGGSLALDGCCGKTVCPRCARGYLTPLGGGEAIVRCSCGAVRKSRLR